MAAFHWVVGLAVLGQFALGWWMLDVPKGGDGERAWWFNLHKSIGMTRAYVACELANTVYAIDAHAHRVIAPIPAGEFSNGVAMRPDGKR